MEGCTGLSMSYTFPDFPAAATFGPTQKPGFYARFGKRLFDVALVGLAAPVWVPLLAVIWLATAAEGGGGFFRQERIGRHGQRFVCWKIRTMVPGAQERLAACLRADPALAREWERTQKLQNDPRLSRFGRVLRATSLDELPQLWNVLKGDMSLIGPRPFLPEQKPQYDAQATGWAYYGMRPGLSGPWQVGARNDAPFSARARYDFAYWQRLSLREDLGLLFKTVITVLRAGGL